MVLTLSVMLAIGDILASSSQQIKGFKIDEIIKRYPAGLIDKLFNKYIIPLPYYSLITKK